MDALAQIGGWLWFIAWVILLLSSSLLVYFGLGGNFIIVGLALLHGLATGFDPLSWRLLVILLALALLAEGIEFVLGTFYVARKGASRHAVVGAFCGGLLGALAGAPLLPILGAVFGSFLGAFIGAILGEYHHRRHLEPSLRVGGHAFLGRLIAVLTKHAIGLAMVTVILKKTWPAGPG
jgi:uncharacterized protein YqgC (DUF456 family)